jgi:hypothetical protein
MQLIGVQKSKPYKLAYTQAHMSAELRRSCEYMRSGDFLPHIWIHCALPVSNSAERWAK